jgi:hypothetical protein
MLGRNTFVFEPQIIGGIAADTGSGGGQ